MEYDKYADKLGIVKSDTQVTLFELRKYDFEEVGELRKYTTVSGGGISWKGALLEYAIAEDIGVIIGSREPITRYVA